MPFSQKLFLPILIGLSLCGASAYLVYLLTKTDDEGDNIPRSSSYRRSFDMKIPKGLVAPLIGRGGSNIKEIQEKSGCRIHFKDENSDEEERTCVIRGSSDEILVAELLIKEFLDSIASIEVEQIWIPKTACGRIIGRCGENIQRVVRSSNAKIIISSEAEGADESQRKITIKGTCEQISIAKSMIETFVAEDEEIRQNLSQRQPRGPPRVSPAPSPTPLRKDVSSTSIVSSKNEKFLENGSNIDGQIEVYVSAVDDPGKFWVQIVGPKATELDQLVDQMTEYYGKEENASLHELADISIGEIVAAKFEFDNKWYRAEIKKIKSNKDKNDILELYFVDYGDVGIANRNEVYELRTDFLRLRFQAIECYLANVEPVNREWSEEAIDLFEELTQVAQWKKLWSKVVCYRDQRGGTGDSKDRRRREGSPIPGIQLYDNTKNGDLNVAAELVKAGFAVYEKDSASLHGSPSLSSLNNEHVTSKSKNFDSMKLSNDSMDESSTLSEDLSEVGISESIDTKIETSDSPITPSIPTIKLSDVDNKNLTPSSSNNDDNDLIFSTPAKNTNKTFVNSISSDDNDFQQNGNNTEISGDGTGDQLLFNTPSSMNKHSPAPKSTDDFLANERLTHGGTGDSHMASSTPLTIKKNAYLRKIE